jgi:hypothetical protein
MNGNLEQETNDSTTKSSNRTWRPNFIRDVTLVALILGAYSAYKSHATLHRHFIHITNGITVQHQPTMMVPSKKATIAYAVSLTSCQTKGGAPMNLDGAAVLKHSIERLDSKYDSKFYAFVHPNATSCLDTLENLGFTVQVRPTPVNTSDIRGPLLKFVEGASCCGSAEFLKLYTYILTEHPVAVHLDMDVLVLKPLDDLYDAMMMMMIDGSHSAAEDAARARLPAMWTRNAVTDLPQQINAYFTRDYNMLTHAGFRKPIETSMQGGFMVVRPNVTVFQEYLNIILEGKYEAGQGWGAPELRFGGTYGAAQIQGLVTYYYGHFYPGTAVELNRCIYNNMVDNPRDKHGKCLSPQQDAPCEDCRLTNISEVVTTHFTECQKPWWCHGHHKQDLCHQTHREWFKVRMELEMKRKRADPSYTIMAVQPEPTDIDEPWVVNGNASFCGPNGYIQMTTPSS